MPENYTPQEYANMHFVYGECQGNSCAAARLYRERYPNLRHPDHRVFRNVHLAYSQGVLPGNRGGLGRPRGDYDEDVLQEIQNDPSTSTRNIERNLGISKSVANRILRRYGYHPYHIQRVQALLPRDYPLRVQFCQTMLQKHREDPNFINMVLWSDESTFKRDGFMNMHNLHSYALENPHLMREDRSQYQFKVNLWTGILDGKIIGPFELPETLNGPSYLHFLENELPNLLDDVPLATRRSMWLQNDGCPAHYAREVRLHLNQTYPQKWIGRLGPILWPPRSPDLNPLDFYYWGYIKEKVYNEPINSIAELRQRIYAEAQNDVSRSARHISRAFLRRCRACIQVNGGQFEHLI